MTSVAQRLGKFTFNDFLVLVKDSAKADLLDGVIYMASPESTDENELGGWLYAIMRQYVEAKDLGRVFYTRVAFRITEARGPEPDLAFVAKRRLRLVRKGFVDGPPDLAVEIVSPDSVERDYVTKRAIYESAGVREYWIIDPYKKEATVLRLHQRRFRKCELEQFALKSSVLVGFSLDVRWFWSKRRPSSYRVLETLLRGE